MAAGLAPPVVPPQGADVGPAAHAAELDRDRLEVLECGAHALVVLLSRLPTSHPAAPRPPLPLRTGPVAAPLTGLDG